MPDSDRAFDDLASNSSKPPSESAADSDMTSTTASARSSPVLRSPSMRQPISFPRIQQAPSRCFTRHELTSLTPSTRSAESSTISDRPQSTISAWSARFDNTPTVTPIDVSITTTTPIDHLPAAVEVAAYRIATEALTNVARHADARSARVELSVNGDFSLIIADDGPCTTPWVAGVGLGSMRTRVDELGGTINAGAGPHGGLVTARLPLPSS